MILFDYFLTIFKKVYSGVIVIFWQMTSFVALFCHFFNNFFRKKALFDFIGSPVRLDESLYQPECLKIKKRCSVAHIVFSLIGFLFNRYDDFCHLLILIVDIDG